MIPTIFYQEHLGVLEAELAKLQQKATKLPYWRLFILLFTFFAFYLLFPFGWSAVLYVFLAGMVSFFWVVKLDASNNEQILICRAQIEACKSELKALDLNFDGSEIKLNSLLKINEHPFAIDLDVFGGFSLFSFLNRTTVTQSAEQLKQWLLNNCDTEEIIQRQKAAQELSKKPEWRIKMMAAGKLALNTIPQQKIIDWFRQKDLSVNAIVFVVAKLLPLVTLATIITSFYIDLNKVVTLLIIAHILIISFTAKKFLKIYQDASGITILLKQYAGLIALVENEQFENEYLKKTTSVFNSSGKKSSKELRELSSIINNLDLKNNVYFWLPLNILFFWDIQYTEKLLKWKAKNGSNIEKWMDAICELEVLNSVAAIHFNHPNWTLPKYHNGNDFKLIADNCGHPLLKERKCVKNSITINKSPFVVVLTGSNMSGKSTFLRTIGTNLVLAKIGSVVCADNFELNNFELYSSMRIADDLANDTSTFYAELKRLKAIVDQLKKDPNTFVLLDEILRGTNSLDRHKGAAALIKQIIRTGGVSIVATHDVVLSELENEFPGQIANFHFDVSVDGEELYFDYKLKQGVCQSLNAAILMKKMGIEL